MTFIAAFDGEGASYAWLGLIPAAAIVAALIFNVSTFVTKDLNRKAGVATSLLLIAMLVETATWTVRSFDGGRPGGAFVVLAACAVLHIISASHALGAFWEFRTIGRWPYGRRRATWGFWLNVIALLALSGWFFLLSNERYSNRLLR